MHNAAESSWQQLSEDFWQKVARDRLISFKIHVCNWRSWSTQDGTFKRIGANGMLWNSVTSPWAGSVSVKNHCTIVIQAMKVPCVHICKFFRVPFVALSLSNALLKNLLLYSASSCADTSSHHSSRAIFLSRYFSVKSSLCIYFQEPLMGACCVCFATITRDMRGAG